MTPLNATESSSGQSVLGRTGKSGNQGVIGRKWEWSGTWDSTLTLANQLNDPVKDVRCLFVFYDGSREPIHLVEGYFRDVMPPGLAKRVEQSTYRRSEDMSALYGLSRLVQTLEIRALDFQIVKDQRKRNRHCSSLSSGCATSSRMLGSSKLRRHFCLKTPGFRRTAASDTPADVLPYNYEHASQRNLFDKLTAAETSIGCIYDNCVTREVFVGRLLWSAALVLTRSTFFRTNRLECEVSNQPERQLYWLRCAMLAQDELRRRS